MTLFSVAVGADTHAHAGSTEADPATFAIAAALDVAFTRSGVAVRLADDDASLAALTPATAVFIAYHADVLDVAVRDYRSIDGERRCSGGSCEERACAQRETDCYLVHDVLQTRYVEASTALLTIGADNPSALGDQFTTAAATKSSREHNLY